MTVERVFEEVEGPYASCVWFDARQVAQRLSFKTAALNLAPRST